MTQPWAAGPLVGFDTETTGVDQQTARVVQAALVVVEPDGTLAEDSTCFTVNPLVEIPAEASAIHGLTADKVALSCRTSTMVDTLVLRMEELGVAEGRVPLVIFNVQYDWSLLLAEARRCNRDVGFTPLFLDPLVIDREADRRRKGGHKLDAVAKTYGVRMDAAHDAGSDALTAVRIMRAMLALWPRFRETPLEELQVRQAKFHKTWSERMNEYWASNGKEQWITGAWPYGDAAVPALEQVGVA